MKRIVLSCFALVVAPTAFATDQASDMKVWATADHGPFLCATIVAPWPKLSKGKAVVANQAIKGIAIKLGPDAGMCFDTDLLRWQVGWTGGWLEFVGVVFNGRNGIPGPNVLGAPIFATRQQPGCADPNGAFEDPRPRPFGPLPTTWGRYDGLWRHGDTVVVRYRIGEVDVLEMPVREDGLSGSKGLARCIRIGARSTPVTMIVSHASGSSSEGGATGMTAWLSSTVEVKSDEKGAKPEEKAFLLAAGLTGGDLKASLSYEKDALLLTIPAGPAGFTKLVMWNPSAKGAAALPSGVTPALDPAQFAKPGPAVTTAPVSGGGKVGTAAPGAAFVVDALTLPTNPYKTPIRWGGFDFAKNGAQAVLCSYGSGDVWTVDGLDATLGNVSWRRLASGLHQPLGVVVASDGVYVHGKDQITRLVDVDGDGCADRYDNFCNLFEATPSFHEFSFDLHRDQEGRFYCAKASPVAPGGGGYETIAAHHGCLMRIAADGLSLTKLATGLRAPNGIGLGPNGELTSGDNEGSWMPVCRLNLIKEGSFHGVVPTAHRSPPPTMYDQPLCWLPKSVDNSGGGQAWVPHDRFGGPAMKGQLLHTSYGTSGLFLAMIDRAREPYQAAVVRLPVAFESGIMRPRFHPTDGSLWIAGLRGWQTNAGKNTCFQRVRATGAPLRMPIGFAVTATGLRLTFASPLAASSADAGSFTGEMWNYRWSGSYGSKDYKLSAPETIGRDPFTISKAELSADGLTLNLTCPDLKPCMQFSLAMRLGWVGVSEATPVTIFGSIWNVGK